MKKIILSAAVAAMAFSTSAVAADKGIDIDVTGQAVIYYETHSSNQALDKGQLDQANSTANAGIQLNLGSDLGNNFTFGSQLTYLGTLGLEKTLVDGTKQTAGSLTDTTAQLALTKIFVAKQIANTTLKMGRQELPKSLSPLAFTEGWRVYKNTFDAVLAVNTDLPKTTLVGAYVTGGTGSGNLGTTGDLAAGVNGAAYMITAQTKLIPMTTLTATMYDLNNIGGVDAVTGVAATQGNAGTAAVAKVNGIDAQAYWLDAQIAPKDAPLGLKLALQAGTIAPDATGYADTDAFGAKLSAKVSGVSLKAIYTSVDGDENNAQIAMRNTGTNVKSPLYSQMMYNQNAIVLDSDTIVVGAAYDAGSIGKFAVNYGMSDIGKDNGIMNSSAKSVDYSELDVVYKIKSGGVQYFAIAAFREIDAGGVMNTTTGDLANTTTDDTVLRFWARYNF